MRILVTGGSGFAGGHLISELVRTGDSEIIASCPADRPGAQQEGLEDSQVEWLPLDITSKDSVRSAIRAARPDRVYHLAGQASVGQSFRSPEETWEINATGTLRLLQGLADEAYSSARVLLVSSAEVYGGVAPEDQPITEEHPMRPVSPYGASKAAAEMIGAQFALSGALQVVIARSFNHIGPGQDERFVLPSFARQLVRIRRCLEDPVLRVGNLDVDRDFLDVRDVVRAYALLMERGETGSAYNIASGRMVSLEEVVLRLVELSGVEVEIVTDPDRVRPVDIPALLGDASRVRDLGWAPAYGLDDTLTDLLRWAESRESA